MLLIGLTLWIFGQAAGCAPPRGVYHTVEEGQTLYQIGRTYGIDVDDLARVNRIQDPTQIKVGTRILIPGADRKKVVPVTALPKDAVKGRGDGRPQPAGSGIPRSPETLSKEAAVPSKPTVKSQPASGKAPKFIWPLKGEVVRKFSVKSNPPSKGIEIAAREGSPVAAAAPGQVIYSGNGIPSFGNLIILRHDGNFFTVYGYNQKNLVNTGSFVGQGDRIALSGIPPSKGRPRLYFEVRFGKETRDPIFFLP